MKIFRGLRKKLLTEGKFKKYLLYAIGEILLVMIGILLAFQVNEWNKGRILENSKVTIYKNVIRQLKEDTSLIGGNIDYNLAYLKQYREAIEIIEEKDLNMINTLVKAALNLTKYSDFHSDNSVFKTLVNNGEIKLLTNDEIVLSLQRLDEKYVYINQLEQTHFDAMKLYLIPQITASVKVHTAEALDTSALFTPIFQNNFVLMASLMVEKDSVYQNARNQIASIVNSIEKEIE